MNHIDPKPTCYELRVLYDTEAECPDTCPWLQAAAQPAPCIGARHWPEVANQPDARRPSRRAHQYGNRDRVFQAPEDPSLVVFQSKRSRRDPVPRQDRRP